MDRRGRKKTRQPASNRSKSAPSRVRFNRPPPPPAAVQERFAQRLPMRQSVPRSTGSGYAQMRNSSVASKGSLPPPSTRQLQTMMRAAPAPVFDEIKKNVVGTIRPERRAQARAAAQAQQAREQRLDEQSAANLAAVGRPIPRQTLYLDRARSMRAQEEGRAGRVLRRPPAPPTPPVPPRAPTASARRRRAADAADKRKAASKKGKGKK